MVGIYDGRAMEEFTAFVYDVLIHHKSSISPQIAKELLQEDPFLDEYDFPELTSDRCYFKYPLYKELLRRLYEWMQTSINPTKRLQTFALLEESSVPSNEDSYQDIEQQLLQQLQVSWKGCSVDEKTCLIVRILNSLDNRMVLDILGIRHTMGSIDAFPPPLGALVKSFCHVTKPTVSSLTVGARALSKHFHRDETAKFWGSCSGSESAKNAHACTILYKLLNDIAWVNAHVLPHDVKIFEVRCSLGYGARWSIEGSEFRGFLEPQMADGHSTKWKH